MWSEFINMYVRVLCGIFYLLRNTSMRLSECFILVGGWLVSNAVLLHLCHSYSYPQLDARYKFSIQAPLGWVMLSNPWVLGLGDFKLFLILSARGLHSCMAAAVTENISIFWKVMPCSQVGGHWCFRGTWLCAS
jgi:hypothetical protein